MRQGRIVAGAGALAALGVLAAPQVVSAHVADVVKTCDHLDVSVGLFDDSVQTHVTIDGNTTVHSGNGHWTFAWSETEVHSYTVVVDAVNPADDKTFTGEQQACTHPPDSSTAGAVTTATTMGPDTTTTEPETSTTQAGTPPTESTTPLTPITQNLATPTVRGSGSGGAPGDGGGSRSSGGSALPSTGPNDTAPFIAAGIGALAGGSALVYVARRGSRGGPAR